jgi:hypothetical protein
VGTFGEQGLERSFPSRLVQRSSLTRHSPTTSTADGITEDVMGKSKKEPQFVEHPDDLKSQGARDRLASSITDQIVDEVKKRRAAAGKPPLK